jgi:hypothetical protein
VIRTQAENQQLFATSGEERLHYLAQALCGVLKGDNPRFDEGRFMRACFPEGVTPAA